MAEVIDTLHPFLLNVISIYVFLFLVMRTLIDFEFVFHARACCCFFVAWRVPRIPVFTVLSVGFPYFTNVVQLLYSLSEWLHLNCSSVGTGFNGAETSCRVAHNLGILLMNSNYFAFFQQHFIYVFSEIYHAQTMIWSLIRSVTFLSKKTITVQLSDVVINSSTYFLAMA